jgi:hypothetical protein
MPLSPGNVVRLIATRVSVAGGKTTEFEEGLVGRVCKVSESGSGFCCVRFPSRCQRVHERFLERTTGAAPRCDEECTGGC